MTNTRPTSVKYFRRRLNRRGGFTFVEFLIVTFVIITLMALMSGIAVAIMENSARQRTAGTMKTIISAVEAYQTATKSAPAETTAGGVNSLLKQLKGCDASRKKIDLLPTDAISKDSLVDGWGWPIKYDKDGPVNTKTGKPSPLLISPGPDGDFQTEEDNIRSDIHVAN